MTKKIKRLLIKKSRNYRDIDPTQDNLVQMYNKIQKAARPNNNHNGNMDIYDHNVKRVYDKVKFLFPNADISR